MIQDKDKQIPDDNVEGNEKNKGPFMILTNRKVVGHADEQWKEV